MANFSELGITVSNTDEATNSLELSPNTVKRNPNNLDLNKNHLLQLLCQVEAELEAREIALAVLKSDKAKQLLYQAKYGRFSLGDPFLSLQRDSDCQKDHSFDEVAVKSMYDNQLVHLENLIATQRKAQQRMRDQLIAVEKRFHKVCVELEEEKRKHAQDTAQGDDVTYMLEKDRERLKMEVEGEKANTRKVEKELKKARVLLTEQQDMSVRHKQVAVMLIKERKELVRRLLEAEHVGESGSQLTSNQKSEQVEAVLERQLKEFDMEREQYKARLVREEARNSQLTAEIERLSMYIEQLQQQIKRRTDGGLSSGESKLQLDSVVSPTSRVFPTSLPGPVLAKMPAALATFRNTPPHTPPESRRTHSEHDASVQQSSRLSGSHDHLLRQVGADLAALRVDIRLPARSQVATGVSPHLNNTHSPVALAGARASLVLESTSNAVRNGTPARSNGPPVSANKPHGQKEKPLPPPRFVGISPASDISSKPSDDDRHALTTENSGPARKPVSQVLVK